MNKKAAIYDPYLDTLGGGERYCLTVAEILLANHYSVDIFWSGDQTILSRAEKRFDLSLSLANLVPDIFFQKPTNLDLVEDSFSSKNNPPPPASKIPLLIKRFSITRKYDVFFYLSDWSLPFLFAKKNLLHIQVPFVYHSNLFNFLHNLPKLALYKKVICNSQFTHDFAAAKFGDKCTVIYPPVDVEKFTPSPNKENIILTVGRFDNILNSKKQEILLQTFRQLYSQNKHFSWKFILAGGSQTTPDKNVFLTHLIKISHGLPVEFVINPDFKSLRDLYSRAKIYWHAAGYGVNQNLHPENTEHFGITPVEAMASGMVPLLVYCGGLPEIIDDGQNGFLWHQPVDLIGKTSKLIASPALLSQISSAAIKKSQQFSKGNFSHHLLSIINQ